MFGLASHLEFSSCQVLSIIFIAPDTKYSLFMKINWFSHAELCYAM